MIGSPSILHFEADGYVGSIITNWLPRHGSVAEMPADKLPGNISKINNPTDVNAKMILFTSALNVFMVLPLELDNFIQY